MRLAVAGGSGLVGRYVVEAAQARGHNVVVLSRAHGVNLQTGDGFRQAIDGVEAIVDATNARPSQTDFFTDVARRLQSAEPRHIVTLSIVGVDRAPHHAYYATKVCQEQVALGARVPATVLRATQFHEFVWQMLSRQRAPTAARIPSQLVQTVAARTVGSVLVELIEAPRSGETLEVAGPERADLVDLARQFVQHRGLAIEVHADPPDPAIPPGALLPSANARIEGPTFAQWLTSEDAERLTL